MSANTANQAISNVLESLEAALKRADTQAAVDLFQPDCYWRDLVAFTWNIKTLEGREQIAAMLDAQLTAIKPSKLRLVDNEPATEADGVTQGWITFETGVARGNGFIRLKESRIWTLLTTMAELKGHEDPKGLRRPMGAEHGARRDRTSWKERREAELDALGVSEQPYCLIVGGGQGGIGLGARLRQLGVPTIIVDKNERLGDAWRKRYKTLCLHDPVWYDHMPYLPFPDNRPVFTPKDKIGDWLEMYTKVMELNYWGSTVCKSARYDEANGEWIVEVERAGQPITLRPKQLVLATGMSGKPNMPSFKGMDVFKGEQHHSSQHPGPDAYQGKKVVVIGANNSAHDICAALWEAGVDVTVVQRSSTHIVKSDSLMDLALGDLYPERAVAAGMTTAKADLTFASIPYAILHQFQIPVFNVIRERDAEFYARPQKSGFMLDFGDDDSGLFMKYLRRGSGYYIDVGASELVADGRIKLKSGVDVVELKEHSVLLSDGSELEADLVVYATGYG
ncbi:MAG: Flavin-containing monooxygenase [uncultured Paraburkholderia sp.]|nr:MAG: Flavin-containing monooxygenase [uncultured Paraburkholderia sp.]